MFVPQSLSRPGRPTALAIATGALATLLAACSSQSPSSVAPPGAPGAPGAPHGDLTLSSAESGSIALTTSTCAFGNDKPNAFDGAAAATTSGATSVSGAASGSAWRVRLTTSNHPAGYAAEGLTGVTATKQGDMWKVTLTDLRLPAIDKPSAVLQVSGTVLCSAAG